MVDLPLLPCLEVPTCDRIMTVTMAEQFDLFSEQVSRDHVTMSHAPKLQRPIHLSFRSAKLILIVLHEHSISIYICCTEAPCRYRLACENDLGAKSRSGGADNYAFTWNYTMRVGLLLHSAHDHVRAWDT